MSPNNAIKVNQGYCIKNIRPTKEGLEDKDWILENPLYFEWSEFIDLVKTEKLNRK
jgi:hypothetical protein